MLKFIFKIIVKITKPLVWHMAEAYDLRINKHCLAQGQHSLIIEDHERAKNNIPKSVYFNTRSGKITIGANTVFGEDVLVLTGKHYNIEEAKQDNLPLHYVPESGRDIIIGKNCYIGSGAIIIGPVTIGDYAVIGAGAIVTKDIPSGCFAAGVPAKVLKKLAIS